MKRFFVFILFLSILFSGCVSDAAQSTATSASEQLPAEMTLTLTPKYTSLPEITPDVMTPEATATPEPVPTLLDEYYITGVYGHKQYFSLGCEAGVAVDWASYFDVDINEFEFQMSLPLSDNPDLGFVGSVDGPWGQIPPYAYGVHAEPVAKLLQEYGVNALAVKGYTLEQLKQQIVQDRPVIAWVIGNVVGGIPSEYTDSQGNTTIVAAYEHVIIVFGYNQDMIRYNNNGKVYDIPVDIFENSWSVLGNMALVMGDMESTANTARTE